MNYETPRPNRSNLVTFLRKTIGEQFVIPVYQRNYTWTASKEVNQYLVDLENVINGKYDSHFIGIIIYLINVLDSYGTTEFSVIDGQQRLTTTFLILYAVRDILLEQGNKKEATLIENRILTNQDSEGSHRYKLKPLVADDQVYQEVVNGNLKNLKKEDKTSNVYKNFTFIKEKLHSWIDSGIEISLILDSLDKLYIVNVPIGELDNSQKIFESINSTGTKLTASDLIRNFILMDLDSEQQDYLYHNYWKKLEVNITSDAKKLEAFFRFFLATKTYYLSNKSAVYREFKKWHDEEIEKGFSTEDVFKEILKYSQFFNYIYHETIETKDPLYSSMMDFRKNISDMPAPFLLGIYNLYNTEDDNNKTLISAKQFSDIVDLLNVYLIRRSLAGLDTSDITRLFPKLLKDTLNDCNEDFSNILEYVKRNLINSNRGKNSKMPDDDELRNHLLNANAYSIKLTIRIVFEKLENKDNSAPVDQKKLSIEHLLPQTGTDYWRQATKMIDVEEYDKYLNKIGNLTLASKSDNSAMGNSPFEYKKNILKSTSHLKMNELILQKNNWTKKEIDERTNNLISEIIEIYPYTSASEEVIVKHKISLDNNGLEAFGYLYEEDGSVEILEDSKLPLTADSHAFPYCENLYSDLVEAGIIVELDNYSIFKKSYEFRPKNRNSTSLSLAASFLMRVGSRNGWYVWKNSDGKSLNDNKELKVILTQKK